jgi:hypothetical protein
MYYQNIKHAKIITAIHLNVHMICTNCSKIGGTSFSKFIKSSFLSADEGIFFSGMAGNKSSTSSLEAVSHC